MYEIRFLEMSQEDFEKYVSPTGILTDTEIARIRQKLEGQDVPNLEWKEHRKWRSIVNFSRFDPANVDDEFSRKEYNGDSDALTLTANKAVLFHGVRLFGSRCGQYEVKFKIGDENVSGTYDSEQGNDGVSGYDVILPKPISLPPDVENTITATIRGPDSSTGWNGRSTIEVDDIVVTVENAPTGLSSNGTSKTQGQFYKIFSF